MAQDVTTLTLTDTTSGCLEQSAKGFPHRKVDVVYSDGTDVERIQAISTEMVSEQVGRDDCTYDIAMFVANHSQFYTPTTEQTDWFKSNTDGGMGFILGSLALAGECLPMTFGEILDGRDVRVNGVGYTDVLDTFGISNGVTMTMHKNESSAEMSGLVKRRSSIVADYALRSSSFYKRSGYKPQFSLSEFGMPNLSEILGDTNRNKIGYPKSLWDLNTSAWLTSSKSGSPKRHVVLKVYKESVNRTIARTTDRPHLLVRRDGSVMVLRMFSENVNPSAILPNSTEDLSYLSDFLLVGLEGHAPLEFSVGRYSFQAELAQLAEQIATASSAAKPTYQAKYDALLANYVPDYSYCYELSGDDLVVMHYKRNDSVPSYANLTMPLDEKGSKERFISVLREDNPFTRYSPNKYAYTQEYLNWFSQESDFTIEDYDLKTIYGDESESEIFGDETTGIPNLVRYVGNRKTKWDVLGKYSPFVNPRGKDLYQLMEEAQLADYMIAKHSQKALEVYSSVDKSGKVITDVLAVGGRLESTTTRLESISTKSGLEVLCGEGTTTARTIYELVDWFSRATNHQMSKRSGCLVGVSQALKTLSVTKTDDLYRPSYSPTSVVDPELERDVVMWRGQRLADPLFNHKYIHVLEQRKLLTASIFMDDLLSTESTQYDSYPDDIPSSGLSVEKALAYNVGANAYLKTPRFADDFLPSDYIKGTGKYLIKGFKEAYEAMVSQKSIPDLEMGTLSFSAIMGRQNSVTKNAAYLTGEIWKVSNPQHVDLGNSLSAIPRWAMNVLVSDPELKTASRNATERLYNYMFTEASLAKHVGAFVYERFTKPNERKDSVVSPISWMVDYFAPEGSVSKTNVDTFVSKFVGIDSLVSAKDGTIGLGLLNVSETELLLKGKTSSIGLGGVPPTLNHLRGKALSDTTLGYLAFHWLAPMMVRAKSNMSLQLEATPNAIRTLVGNTSFSALAGGRSIGELLFSEYSKLFSLDELVRSCFTSPNMLRNIAPPLKTIAHLPSASSYVYGATASDVGIDVVGKRIGFPLHEMDTLFVVNEDPTHLFAEVTANGIEKGGAITEDGNFKDANRAFFRPSTMTPIAKTALKEAHGSEMPYTEVDKLVNATSLRDKSMLVYNMVPFRSAYDTKSYRSWWEAQTDTDKTQANSAKRTISSPTFRSFYGNTEDVVDSSGNVVGMVCPLNRPTYISKMPEDFCISSVIRDALHDYVSAAIGIRNAKEIDLSPEAIDAILSRAICVMADHFRFFVEDFAYELSALANRLSKDEFGDQVLGGVKISSYSHEDDALATFLSHLDKHCDDRMAQEYTDTETRRADLGFASDSVYIPNLSTPLQGEIAYVVHRMMAAYETILELKNSSFHMDISSSSERVAAINGAEGDYGFVRMNDTIDFVFAQMYSNVIKEEDLARFNSAYASGVFAPSAEVAQFNLADHSRLEARTYVKQMEVAHPITWLNQTKLNFGVYETPNAPIHSKSGIYDGKFLFVPDSFASPLSPNVANDVYGGGFGYETDDLLFPYYVKAYVTRGTPPAWFGGTPSGLVVKSHLDYIKNWQYRNPLNAPSNKVEYFSQPHMVESYLTSYQAEDRFINYFSAWSVDGIGTPSKEKVIEQGYSVHASHYICGDLLWYESVYINDPEGSSEYDYDLNFSRRAIKSEATDVNKYRFHWNELSGLAVGQMRYYDSVVGKNVGLLGSIVGTYETTNYILSGYEARQMAVVNPTQEFTKAKTIWLHAQQVAFWYETKVRCVSEIGTFLSDKKPLVGFLGDGGYYRGFRFFAPPTQSQTDCLYSLMQSLGCLMPSLTFPSDPLEYSSEELKTLLSKRSSNGYVITTNNLSERCVDFNPTWSEAFSNLGCKPSSTIAACSFPESSNQFHKQTYALLCDMDDLLLGKPKYVPYFGGYEATLCSPLPTTDETNADSTTDTPNCANQIGSKNPNFTFSNDVRNVNWADVFSATSTKFGVSDVGCLNILGTSFRYRDTMNTDGSLRVSAEQTMSSEIDKTR